MTFAGIIAFLVGAGLAQKFRIFILVPLLLATLLAAMVALLSAAADTRSIALTTAVAAIAMQGGYLAGAVLRWWKVSRSRKASAALKNDKAKSGADALPVH